MANNVFVSIIKRSATTVRLTTGLTYGVSKVAAVEGAKWVDDGLADLNIYLAEQKNALHEKYEYVKPAHIAVSNKAAQAEAPAVSSTPSKTPFVTADQMIEMHQLMTKQMADQQAAIQEQMAEMQRSIAAMITNARPAEQPALESSSN